MRLSCVAASSCTTPCAEICNAASTENEDTVRDQTAWKRPGKEDCLMASARQHPGMRNMHCKKSSGQPRQEITRNQAGPTSGWKSPEKLHMVRRSAQQHLRVIQMVVAEWTEKEQPRRFCTNFKNESCVRATSNEVGIASPVTLQMGPKGR